MTGATPPTLWSDAFGAYAPAAASSGFRLNDKATRLVREWCREADEEGIGQEDVLNDDGWLEPFLDWLEATGRLERDLVPSELPPGFSSEEEWPAFRRQAAGFVLEIVVGMAREHYRQQRRVRAVVPDGQSRATTLLDVS